jgi:oligopeptide transport system substrate-binding protein
MRLAKGLLLVLVVFLFFSCGKAKNEGMTLRFNNGTEPQTLDPAIMTGVPEFKLAMQIFEGLTAYNPTNLSPIPGVAQKWEVSSGGLVYTFHLRTNAAWSDGVSIDAETFRYSWLRALSPETASEYAYQLWYIKNAQNYTKKLVKAEEVGIKAIDKTTLQVTLENPTPYFISLLSFQTYLPVPRHVIEKAGSDKWILPQNIVGNGPFVLKEWFPKDHIKLVKSLTYWDREKVKLDTVYFYAYEDASSALEMFLNNELDWIDTIPSERMDQMKQKPEFHKAPFLGTYFYRIHINANKALSDVRVRKALSLSINRDYICKYIGKAGQIPNYGFVPESMPNYKGYAGDKENPAKARKFLAQAGYPEGKGFPSITILYNTMEDHKKIAEAIQQMWKKELNIDVALENQEWKVYLQRVQSLDYDLSRAGWIGDYVDPNTFLDMFVTDGGNNQTGWSNKKYDELIQKAKREKNPSQRMKIFYEAEKILVEESPIIPIYTYVRVHAIKGTVKGVYDNILDLHPLKEVSVEK